MAVGRALEDDDRVRAVEDSVEQRRRLALVLPVRDLGGEQDRYPLAAAGGDFLGGVDRDPGVESAIALRLLDAAGLAEVQALRATT